MGLRDRIGAFWKPERVKVNPAFQGLISYSDNPQPVMMPKNYKAFAKEGYRGDDTIFKVISYIARNGAAIEPKLYADRARTKEIQKHDLLTLLKKPNDEQSGQAYRESAISYRLLSGNSYQYAIRPGKRAAPKELWVLRPDLIEIIPSPRRGVIGYKYQHIEQPLPPENVAHLKYWNPDNDLYGLSPLEVGAVLVDQQKAASLWNLALLQNSARPPGAWVIPTTLSKNDRDRLELKLKEKLQGYKNAGSPPILDAGLQWQSMGLPPAQLDWLDSMRFNANRLANIYHLAPQLIGDNSASTFNNMDAAKVASYTEAIFPELDDLYALLSLWLIPMFGDLPDEANLYYDKESVEVIQKVIQDQKSAQVERANKLWMNGVITMNEARVFSGMDEIEGGDVYRIGGVLVPVDKLEEYAEQSLTEPAAPPTAIAEPVSENDPNAQAQADQQDPKQPQKQPSKQPPQEEPPSNANPKKPKKVLELVQTTTSPTAPDLPERDDGLRGTNIQTKSQSYRTFARLADAL